MRASSIISSVISSSKAASDIWAGIRESLISLSRIATFRDLPRSEMDHAMLWYGGTEFGRQSVFSLIDTLTSLHDSQALGVG